MCHPGPDFYCCYSVHTKEQRKLTLTMSHEEPHTVSSSTAVVVVAPTLHNACMNVVDAKAHECTDTLTLTLLSLMMMDAKIAANAVKLFELTEGL